MLDGRLTEWDGQPWLHLGEASGPPANIRALHSKDSIVLAVTVPSASPGASEESAFPDALQVGFAQRQGATGFSGDFLRLGFGSGNRSPGGEGPDARAAAAVRCGVYCAARRSGDQTVLEIEISKVLLKLRSARSERRLVVSLAFPVPEG